MKHDWKKIDFFLGQSTWKCQNCGTFHTGDRVPADDVLVPLLDAKDLMRNPEDLWRSNTHGTCEESILHRVHES